MQKWNTRGVYFVATKSKICYSLTVLLLPFIASAQDSETTSSDQIRIEGKVIDKETGEGLFGATIQVKGGYDGMLADYDGNFNLLVPGEESILVVSFVGYIPEEIPVGSKRNFKVELEPNTTALEEVVITGQAAGQIAAQQQQINSNTLVNVVSANRIQENPDANAVEAIGRLPGISVSRSGGEGNQLAVRGLSPGYTNVTVDGVNVAGGQGILSSISQFAISGAEVYKAITADMEGTAVAGAINLSSARIRKGLHYNALAQGGYNTKSQASNIYKYVGQVSNRFFNNKLGLSLTGVAEQSNRSSEILNVGYYTFGNEIDKLLPSSVNLSWNERVNTRRSLNVTMDYDLGDFTRLKFNGIYAWANFSERTQSRSIGGLSGGTASENRNFVLDPIDEKKNLHLAFRGLTTIPGLNNLEVSYGATYSTRTSESLNRRNWGFTSIIPDSNTPFLQELADTAVNRTIDPRTIISRFNDGTNLGPQDYRKGGFGLRESISDREEISTNIDLKLPVNLGFAEGYVKAGGRFRKTSQTNSAIQGSMNMSRQNYKYWYDKFPDLVVHPSQDGGDYQHTLEGFEAGQSPVDLLQQQFSLEKLEETSRWWEHWSDSVYALGDAKIQELTGGTFQRLSYVQNVQNSFYNNTDVTEDYYAGYLMTELNFGKKVMLLPGVRFERTDADLNGLVAAEPFATGLPYYNEAVVGSDSSANRIDNFFLPMLHARIKPADWVYVHLSYTHSINRPSFGQITPNVYADPQNTPGVFQTRNPNLKTELWKSLDAQVTFHGNKIGLFSVNGFYKTVEDKIWTRNYPRVSSDPVVEPWFGPNDVVNMSIVENHPYDIYLAGAELEWQTAFYYLPKPFNFFTLNVNYTYTKSQTVYNRSSTEQVTIEGQRFPVTVRKDEVLEDRMVDQPRHIGNVSLGFENSGFNVWLSYQYNGDNITSINQNNPLRDVLVRDFSRLDLQIQYKFPFKQLPGTLQFLGNFGNLTNFVEGQSLRGDPRPTNEVSYGTSVELGLRYRL